MFFKLLLRHVGYERSIFHCIYYFIQPVTSKLVFTNLKICCWSLEWEIWSYEVIATLSFSFSFFEMTIIVILRITCILNSVGSWVFFFFFGFALVSRNNLLNLVFQVGLKTCGLWKVNLPLYLLFYSTSHKQACVY